MSHFKNGRWIYHLVQISSATPTKRKDLPMYAVGGRPRTDFLANFKLQVYALKAKLTHVRNLK
jgi:hypothetical protein